MPSKNKITMENAHEDMKCQNCGSNQKGHEMEELYTKKFGSHTILCRNCDHAAHLPDTGHGIKQHQGELIL